MKILVSDRQLVRPGDCLAIVEEVPPNEFKWYPDKHIYIQNQRAYSEVLGVASVNKDGVSVIPLYSVYIPRKDDVVIGVIESVGITAWTVDIGAPYKAVLPGSDAIDGFNPLLHNLRSYLDVGDMVIAKIAIFDRARDPILTIRGKGLGKIIEGNVVAINPAKVARIIGRKGSMYNLLVNKTKCEILVANNGYIWYKCPDEYTGHVLTNALKLIEYKAHMPGLTEIVKNYLERKLGGSQ